MTNASRCPFVCYEEVSVRFPARVLEEFSPRVQQIETEQTFMTKGVFIPVFPGPVFFYSCNSSYDQGLGMIMSWVDTTTQH